MVAYLLCAGFGTRMRPLTNETPKSLLPVAGRPILDYLVEDLRSSNLNAIHVAVNRRDAPTFRRWAKEWQGELDAESIRLTIHDNGVASADELEGALGDLQFLISQTEPPEDGALVAGGDSLYRFPLSPILETFAGTTNRVLALYQPDRRKRAHSSILNLEGPHVTGLVEDPDRSTSKRICPSFHLLTRAGLSTVQSYLDDGGDPDTLGTFIDALARKQHVEANRLPKQTSLRLHCNTPKDLRHARHIFESNPRYEITSETVHDCLQKDGS